MAGFSDGEGAPDPGRPSPDHSDLPPHLREAAAGRGETDSAGNPWSGRTFQAHDTTYALDDGSADPALLEALSRFGRHEVGEADVVDAVRGARLLIPLICLLYTSDAADE